MTLDLSAARQLSESIMEDEAEFVIAISASEVEHDYLGVKTVQRSTTPVWSGPVSFRRQNRAPDQTQQLEAGDFDGEVYYVVRTPLEAPEIEEGTFVTITRCDRDPSSVGFRMVVTSRRRSTFAVSQTLRCREADERGFDFARSTP